MSLSSLRGVLSHQILRALKFTPSTPTRDFTRWIKGGGVQVFRAQKPGGRECGYLVSLRMLSQQTKPDQVKGTTTELSSGGLAEQALAMKAAQTKDQGKEEEEAKKAAANQIRALRFTFYAMGGIFLGAGMFIFFSYGAPTYDQKGNSIQDEFTDLPFLLQYWKRASSEVRNYINYIVNPSRDKLLPDPVKPPYHQPPYTLLIELNGVLVHPEWTYKTGWRFKKRPGVDYFLSQVAGYTFEIVVFTHEPGLVAFPIVDALDPQGYFHYRLFRDSTRYEKGVHVKDLNKLNRDLSKVIIIDCNEKAIAGHRNNALIIPRWNGNNDDRALFDLAALVNAIGTSEAKDVRGILENYSQYPDPVEEYRKRQQELVKQEQEALKTAKPNTKLPGNLPSPTGILGSLFRKS